MKIAVTLLSAGLGAALLTPVLAEQTVDPNAQQAKAIIKTFFETLKGELQASMQTGGPIKTIAVCKERAPAIADALSDKTGWEVGRTSLKLRNTARNQPDAWEARVLLQFEERKVDGEAVDTMAYSEIVEANGDKHYRFMKAIPTGEICIVCHGSNIGDELAAVIDKNYPDDQATGYQVGDIRGGFTLSKPL